MKKGKSKRLLDFFAGKGFYVILIVCLAAIGLSGYALFFSGASGTGTQEGLDYLKDLELRDSGGLDWDIPSPPSSWADGSEALPTATPIADAEDGEDGAQAVAGSDIVPPSMLPTAPATLEPQKDTTSATPKPEATPKAKKAVYQWPVKGNVIVSFAGYDDTPVYNKTLKDWRAHLGLDIETDAGAKVTAIRDGTVEDIYEDPLMGTTLVITHEGDVRSVYANLSKIPTVSKGDDVKAGDTIGAVGDTAIGETAETNHLHLEVFKGDKPIDPISVLPKQ